MKINLTVESEISRSTRARQLEAMFDVPAGEKSRLTWSGDLPIDDQPWNVGLIVGPSGCGKSSIARHLFGSAVDAPLEWNAPSVVDDFPAGLSMETISSACSAVGFNTIPSWLRPYGVLSNGERFRVELARRILELPDPIVVDEFTSVVDRQVAQIGSHAVQKFVRRNNRKFIAISCHYDIIDWLQPDWILEPSTMAFTPRGLLQRPQLAITIGRVSRAAWRMFAPFHYLSGELHKGAKCFGLWVEGRLAAFVGIIACPISNGKHRGDAIWRINRAVTLPDWQGLGLVFRLMETVGAAYSALGKRLRAYPAHPSFVRAFRPESWATIKRAGNFSRLATASTMFGTMGGRPCAVFEYIGPNLERRQAELLIA